MATSSGKLSVGDFDGLASRLGITLAPRRDFMDGGANTSGGRWDPIRRRVDIFGCVPETPDRVLTESLLREILRAAAATFGTPGDDVTIAAQTRENFAKISLENQRAVADELRRRAASPD